MSNCAMLAAFSGLRITRRTQELPFRVLIAFFHWFAIVMLLVPMSPERVQPIDAVVVGTIPFLFAHGTLWVAYSFTRMMPGWAKAPAWALAAFSNPIVTFLGVALVLRSLHGFGIEIRADFQYFGEMHFLEQIPLFLGSELAVLIAFAVLRIWVAREED